HRDALPVRGPVSAEEAGIDHDGRINHEGLLPVVFTDVEAVDLYVRIRMLLHGVGAFDLDSPVAIRLVRVRFAVRERARGRGDDERSRLVQVDRGGPPVRELDLRGIGARLDDEAVLQLLGRARIDQIDSRPEVRVYQGGVRP